MDAIRIPHCNERKTPAVPVPYQHILRSAREVRPQQESLPLTNMRCRFMSSSECQHTLMRYQRTVHAEHVWGGHEESRSILHNLLRLFEVQTAEMSGLIHICFFVSQLMRKMSRQHIARKTYWFLRSCRAGDIHLRNLQPPPASTS